MSGLGLGPGPMVFDLDVLMREQVAAQPWSGAPLSYTTDYYTPAHLEAAFDRYVAEHGRFASYVNSHMWVPSATLKPFEAGAHSMDLLMADGACDLPEHTHADGELPGMGVYQANCTSCRWHSIHPDENEAVEAWHDHALPGWRDLPLVPSTLTKPGWDMERRAREKVVAWVQEHYPAAFLEHGSPVRTVRPRFAGRHVVVETLYCPPGWEDWGYQPDPGSGDTGGGEVRVCTFAGAEIPCSTAAGVWDGSCYVKPLSPQPPKDDPRWESHEDGVIVSCVNVADATGGACSEGGACTYTYKWIAAMPGAAPSPETVARQAVASMGLGMGQIGLTGGDPDGTGWRTVIGLPIWLWVADPGPSTTGPNSATASVGTVSVTATATLEQIEWSMTTPRGVVTTICSGANAPGTVYEAPYGAQPSPTCGFHPSQVQATGEVTITGTAYWSVQWAGAGQAGSFGMEPMSQSTQLQVIEVQTLRTEGG